MDLWHSLNGSVILEIVAADPAQILCALYNMGIPLSKIQYVDELTLRLQVMRQYARKVTAFAEKHGINCKILSQKGLYWRFLGLIKRPALLLGLAMYIFLTVFLPTRICFFLVEGNENVPDALLLELASQCGLSFGTRRQNVRSEKVKNALLEAVPELEWVGINTAGCVATISVRERQTVQEQTPVGISSIVASCDGVVQELTVTAGSAACKVGDPVQTGQVLISGYTDCGLSIRAERAKGEIYAVTNRNATFVMMQNSQQRVRKISEQKNYAIIIGKNRINFSKDSGNLDSDCVKIYEQNYVTLPGGFILPVAIVTESCYYYEWEPADCEQDDDKLSAIAQDYLSGLMVAGRVLDKQEEFSQNDGSLCLTGSYACLEMIGREQIEEIIKP